MRCFLASSTRCLSELHRFLQLCCQSEKLEKIVEKAIGKAVKVLVRSMARQQQSVSLSSCEAELCALQIVACHVCISELVRERERDTLQKIKTFPSGKPFGACFFFSEPVAFRRVYGLESCSRTSGESNHHRQSVNARVTSYQPSHEGN